MTRIDFHSHIADPMLYACRLLRKAYSTGCRAAVLTRDAQQLAALDDALWTFSQLDFLPHVAANDALAAVTPIILACDEQIELPHHQLLVNLAPLPPQHFARFERLIEIISQDPADIDAGRERFRFYRQRGYPLTHAGTDKS